jgi:hypothetical protein
MWPLLWQGNEKDIAYARASPMATVTSRWEALWPCLRVERLGSKRWECCPHTLQRGVGSGVPARYTQVAAMEGQAHSILESQKSQATSLMES